MHLREHIILFAARDLYLYPTMVRYTLLMIVVTIGSVTLLSGQATSFRPPSQPESVPEVADSMLIPDSITGHLLIVPFEPRMYRSDFDRAIAQDNRLSSEDIRNNFRIGISNALALHAGEKHPPVALVTGSAEMQEDLRYIYRSVGYQYVLVPPKEPPPPKNFKEKVQRKLKKKAPAPVVGKTEVRDGQLHSDQGDTQRYMQTKVINENMVRYLASKYKAKHVLFINEIDLLYSRANTQQQYEADHYSRDIQVHYSILDQRGEAVAGGLVTETFSSRTNDIRKIISKHFPAIAQRVMADLELQDQADTANAAPDGSP